MQVESRKRVIVRTEWTLPEAAGRAQVNDAFDRAGRGRDETPGPYGRVELTVVDGKAVVGYEAEVELAGQDEWQRRAEAAEAQVARADALAVSWVERYAGLHLGGDADGVRQKAFLNASGQLTAALAEPEAGA